MKSQNPSIHDSKDMEGLKRVTYGQIDGRKSEKGA